MKYNSQSGSDMQMRGHVSQAYQERWVGYMLIFNLYIEESDILNEDRKRVTFLLSNDILMILLSITILADFKKGWMVHEVKTFVHYCRFKICKLFVVHVWFCIKCINMQYNVC